ncbi:uncharacterized protein LOC129206765 [Grus americana]|uniref:uncharacterized protein LOC129206765 n=1 Tax=Grus americana TaxID=9117 RepID=UPI0024083C2F|nr:uncharacterized protein LOC129206765 [Grus americana]
MDVRDTSVKRDWSKIPFGSIFLTELRNAVCVYDGNTVGFGDCCFSFFPDLHNSQIKPAFTIVNVSGRNQIQDLEVKDIQLEQSCWIIFLTQKGVVLSEHAYERDQPVWEGNGDFSLKTEYDGESDSHPKRHANPVQNKLNKTTLNSSKGSILYFCSSSHGHQRGCLTTVKSLNLHRKMANFQQGWKTDDYSKPGRVLKMYLFFFFFSCALSGVSAFGHSKLH